MRARYGPLSDYLRARNRSREALTLSFAKIEGIIGGPLPRSAFTYREWWSNQSDVSNRPQAKAWVEAGYMVDSVQQREDSGSVRFVRRGDPAPRVTAVQKTRPEPAQEVSDEPPGAPWTPEGVISGFIKVAELAGAKLETEDITIEVLPAPHKRPKSLPADKMAVYVFHYGPTCLKVGKAGPGTKQRYIYQHYRPGSASSTLAGSMLKDSDRYGRSFDAETVGAWIETHCSRVNLLLDAQHGILMLTLLEAFVQCRLRPRYEGFQSQRV